MFSTQICSTCQSYAFFWAIISLYSAPDMVTRMCLLERGYPSYLGTLLYFCICWHFISSYYIDWPSLSFPSVFISLRDDKKTLMHLEEVLQEAVFSSGFLDNQQNQQ